MTIINPPGDGHGPPSTFDAPVVISFLNQVLPINTNQVRYYRVVATSQ